MTLEKHKKTMPMSYFRDVEKSMQASSYLYA
jgi:hypothetical protein